MDELVLKCPHIPEQIFGYLDDRSLSICRGVSKSWRIFIDSKKLAWIRILNKYYGSEKNDLLIAAFTGQTEVFEELFDEAEDQNPKVM